MLQSVRDERFTIDRVYVRTTFAPPTGFEPVPPP